jgi:UPF0271 protein
MGLDPSGLEFESYSVHEVADELRQQTGPYYRLSVAASSGKMKIQTPSRASLAEVTDKARALGDKIVLSGTDTSLLALALDLSKESKAPVIVSDDYAVVAVQNVAESLNLGYQSLATFGIREKFNWIFYCPACFKQYAVVESEDCLVCGTKLKRKPIARETATQRGS